MKKRDLIFCTLLCLCTAAQNKATSLTNSDSLGLLGYFNIYSFIFIISLYFKRY